MVTSGISSVNNGSAASVPKGQKVANNSVNFKTEVLDQLPEDTFVRLMKSSGEADNVQGATQEPLRLSYMMQPKHFSVVAKNPVKPEEIIGVVSGTNYGEYAYIDQTMVDSKFQASGVGTNLVKNFKEQIEQQNGGKTSVFTLSEDPSDTSTTSHQFWTNRGFKPLPNALCLSRGEDVKTSNTNQQ